MLGVLKHTAAGWFVWYQVMVDEITSSYESIPIHPHQDELKMVELLNTPVCEFEGRQVDFDIVKENIDTGALESPYIKVNFAKLKPEYPELEGTMNLCEDIVKKKTGKMTEEEWQAAEYGNRFDLNDISLAFRAGIEHGINPNKPNTTDYLNQLRKK